MDLEFLFSFILSVGTALGLAYAYTKYIASLVRLGGGFTVEDTNQLDVYAWREREMGDTRQITMDERDEGLREELRLMRNDRDHFANMLDPMEETPRHQLMRHMLACENALWRLMRNTKPGIRVMHMEAHNKLAALAMAIRERQEEERGGPLHEWFHEQAFERFSDKSNGVKAAKLHAWCHHAQQWLDAVQMYWSIRQEGIPVADEQLKESPERA